MVYFIAPRPSADQCLHQNFFGVLFIKVEIKVKICFTINPLENLGKTQTSSSTIVTGLSLETLDIILIEAGVILAL